MTTRISKEKIAKSKAVLARSIIALVGILSGFLITAQWRSIPDRVTDPIAPYSSLKETKESLYDEQSQLKSEISKLQESLEKTQKDSEDIILSKDELNDLRQKKAIAGLTKLNGPGLIITLNDSKNGSATEESIVHAADIRDIINVLWASGAEAISINDQRVVINTAVDCIVNTILVNNVRLTTPFQVEAIGNQYDLARGLTNENNLSDLYKRKREQGIIFDIRRNNDITVPVFDGSFEVKTGVSQ